MNEIQNLLDTLWPICRSLTGDGNRLSLRHIDSILNGLKVSEVASGSKIFDWEVPEEWNIKDAYIICPNGDKIANFKVNNLHVVGYSTPINKKMDLKELKKHIFTIPEQPDLIPYKTSYYKRKWGFCISHNTLEQLKEGEYTVVIDSELKNGALTYGEYFIKGKYKKEIVISTYICHPSLANDNLSGVIVGAFLAKELAKRNNKFSYRILFVPETLGALCWLHDNKGKLDTILGGLVVTCVGDGGPFRYKKSKNGNSFIDNSAIEVLERKGDDFIIEDYFPFGSDERQYNAPGFNLNFGSLMRTRYNKYPEYHTSADNLEYISAKYIKESLNMYLEVFKTIEQKHVYTNLLPYGEPQLGKRNLYFQNATFSDENHLHNAIIWILGSGDGICTLESVSNDSNLSLPLLKEASQLLEKKGVIEIVE